MAREPREQYATPWRECDMSIAVKEAPLLRTLSVRGMRRVIARTRVRGAVCPRAHAICTRAAAMICHAPAREERAHMRMRAAPNYAQQNT